MALFYICRIIYKLLNEVKEFSIKERRKNMSKIKWYIETICEVFFVFRIQYWGITLSMNELINRCLSLDDNRLEAAVIVSDMSDVHKNPRAERYAMETYGLDGWGYIHNILSKEQDRRIKEKGLL